MAFVSIKLFFWNNMWFESVYSSSSGELETYHLKKTVSENRDLSKHDMKQRTQGKKNTHNRRNKKIIHLNQTQLQHVNRQKVCCLKST